MHGRLFVKTSHVPMSDILFNKNSFYWYKARTISAFQTKRNAFCLNSTSRDQKKKKKVITLKSYLSWTTRAKTSKTDITEPFMVCSSRLVEPESESLAQPDSDL